MKNDIRSRTVRFLVSQSAILGAIMLAFVALSGYLFVKNAIHWQLRNIDDDVLMFAQQAARSGEVPKRGDLGAYMFFILDRDGKYILPRLSRSDDSDKLWQEYELKLIYEMQKRHDGWIYYPDRDRLGWNERQYVIRFVFLENPGWIVAAEGFLSGPGTMLGGFLTPKLFLGLLVILLAAFVLMMMNAHSHYRRVMRAILKSQDNNFIAAPELGPAGRQDSREAARPQSESLSDTTFKDRPATRMPPPAARSFPAHKHEPMQPQSALRASSDLAEPIEPLEDRALGPEPRASFTDNRAGGPGVSGMSLDAVRPAIVTAAPRQFDGNEALSIDMEEIRSPALRDIIRQMREEGQ